MQRAAEIRGASASALATRAAVEAEVDVIFALSAALLRQHGAGRMTPFRRQENSNEPTEGSDERLERRHEWGIRAVTNDLHVTIEGESGTGKDLVATLIHRPSPRAHGVSRKTLYA